MARVTQRRALGVLFLFLTTLFAVIAVAALDARVWVVAVAAGVLAAWVGSLAYRNLLG